MAKAVIYSRGKKLKHPAPAAKDRSGIMNYVVMKNIDVVDELYEEGERPAALTPTSPITIALDYLRNAAAQIVIIEQLSDLSADVAVQEIIIEAVAALGGNLVSVREPQFHTEPRRHAIQHALDFLKSSEKTDLLT